MSCSLYNIRFESVVYFHLNFFLLDDFLWTLIVFEFLIIQFFYCFNFNLNKFKSFADKIIYIKIKKKPNNLHIIKRSDDNHIRNEKHILNGYIWDHIQRNNLMNGLKNCHGNDVIVISDLDEIPNIENLDFNFDWDWFTFILLTFWIVIFVIFAC